MNAELAQAQEHARRFQELLAVERRKQKGLKVRGEMEGRREGVRGREERGRKGRRGGKEEKRERREGGREGGREEGERGI